jgi:hypothetical protein
MSTLSYTSNLEALAAAIEDYAAVQHYRHRKPFEDVLEEQAARLCCSNFGGDNKGLYQYAAELAPSKDQLEALPLQLNWRIKRPSGRPIFTRSEERVIKRGKNAGKTRKVRVRDWITGEKTNIGEIDLRIRHRRYQAFHWLSSRLAKYAPGSLKTMDKAVVLSNVSFGSVRMIGDRRGGSHGTAEGCPRAT